MDMTTVQHSLEKRGFKVSVFATADEAADYLDRVIDATSVGFGGSVTLQQMALVERLRAHNSVCWHWNSDPEGLTSDEMREKAMTTEVYLSSANGLAETGEIINIDGTGNRVASIMFGHKRVYFVIGSNKIAPTYDDALWRARNIAAPKNAQRLGAKTPCAVKGDRCYNCKNGICRALSVLWGPMKDCEMEVVLIDEPLGY